MTGFKKEREKKTKEKPGTNSKWVYQSHKTEDRYLRVKCTSHTK